MSVLAISQTGETMYRGSQFTSVVVIYEEGKYIHIISFHCDMWSFPGNHDCLLCYHNVCLLMRGSQVKLRIDLSFSNGCWNGVLSSQYQLIVAYLWSVLQDVLKNELIQLHLNFGHWQDNITGWEWKLSVTVDVLLNKYFCLSGLWIWCYSHSTCRKSSEHHDLSILQQHDISHDLSLTALCHQQASLWSKAQLSHQWLWHLTGLLMLVTWRDFFSVDSDLSSLMCPVGSNIDGE